MSQNPKVFFWIVCLSLVAVLYQFFAPGLSGDAPLYAYVARAMIESGEYFKMHSGLPEFQPFAEHPHLAYWIAAGFFNVFGAEDWVYRLPGQLFYIGTLLVFWKILKSELGEGRATIGVLLLWTWPLFSKFFANFYLDSGIIFFSLLAVYLWKTEPRPLKGKLNFVMCGLCLGIALLFKGIVSFAAVLCFVLYALFSYKNRRQFIQTTLGFFIPIALYLGVLATTGNFDFLNDYWQSINRRASVGSFSHFFSIKPYLSILKETHSLILTLPLMSLLIWKKRPQTHPFPIIWFSLFAGAYLYTGRYAFQYWTTIMPAIAWLLVGFLPPIKTAISNKIILGTSATALILGAFLQFWEKPLRSPPGDLMDQISHLLKNETRKNELWVFKDRPIVEDFSGTGRVLWYTKLNRAHYIQPGEAFPAASPEKILWLEHLGTQSRLDDELSSKNWCQQLSKNKVSIWIQCQSN